MKRVTVLLTGGVQLKLDVTSQWSYALERGVRNGEGIFVGVDADDVDVKIACRHVLAYSVQDAEIEETKPEEERSQAISPDDQESEIPDLEDGCNS